MSRIPTIVLAIAVSLGTTAMLANNAHTVRPMASNGPQFATDGAFRDGLYLGKLAAQGGLAPRPARGRWSREQDRVSFVAGYGQGYSEFLANAAAANTNASRAQ